MQLANRLASSRGPSASRVCLPALHMPTPRQQIDELFRSHGPMVYRRARTILGSEADAEEAMQDVFIRALGKIDSFEWRSSLSTWLYQITTNLCLNRLRDRARQAQLRSENTPQRAPENVATADDMLVIRHLLVEVPDETWAQAAVYVFIDGMSHREAAEVLGVSKRTVGNMLQRFQQWSKQWLEGRTQGQASR